MNSDVVKSVNLAYHTEIGRQMDWEDELRNLDPDLYYHQQRRADRTYFSRRFLSKRLARKVFGGGQVMQLSKIGDQVVIRPTETGRFEVRATVIENTRDIVQLCIQRFNPSTGPSDRFGFTFAGKEIIRLLELLANIKRVHFPSEERFNINDDELRKLILDKTQFHRVIEDNPDLISSLMQRPKATSALLAIPEILESLEKDESAARDFIAIGYRRKQLSEFARLLEDVSYFEAQCATQDRTPERIWQNFFERNPWIFGYGLSFVFMTNLEHRKLEQITAGASVSSRGKRVDALMKTQAEINSLCFVEIKRHNEPLVQQSQYRAEVWAPSKELAGGVAQAQVTVQRASEDFRRELRLKHDDGTLTGEHLFNVRPKAYLVMGNLKEFQTEAGINSDRFASFELYRRNLWQPEIITYDELYNRARFIVEHAAPVDEASF